MDLWKKIFGFTDGQRPANELAQAIEQPGCPDSWKLIQRRAAQNAEAFEAAFPWVPRNYYRNAAGVLEDAHLLPTWNQDAASPKPKVWAKGDLDSPMPFQGEFWEAARHIPHGVQHLAGVKGFITALPVNWTKGENIRFEFPTALVADNELPASIRSEESARAEEVNPSDETVG
jgi:phospholipase D1/2